MLYKKFRKQFNLQLFTEGEEGNGDLGDPKGDEGKESEGKEGDGLDTQPFAIFPDKASFMLRVSREAKKLSGQAQKDFLDSMGIESAESLKDILTDYNAKKEKEQTESDKTNAKLLKLQLENTDLQNKITTKMKHSAVKDIAGELGVETKRIARFMKLVDMDTIEIENGVVDTNTIKESLVTILDEFPEFKGIQSPGKAGNDFSGDQKDDKKLTIEDIKKMSTKQIQENWEEVSKVLNSQK